MLQSRYKWIYPEKREISPELFAVTGSSILAHLLLNRGIKTANEAEFFLYPEKYSLSSPFVFPDMEKAVERINRAINNQEVILIYGDFDADGVTSTVLLYKTLIYLNANVIY